MLFNSIEFIIFFVALFALYYSVFKEKTKPQNILLLVASYVFYAYASWKILPLLVVSTLIFYGLGIAIFNAKSQKRKTWLTTSGVVFGIAVLGYFKYTNFFISSFQTLFESIGLQTNWHTFTILVPVGISFYTFRLLSYIIDISRGKYEPTRDIIAFSTYVAFFPCILSGPIDRPNTLIPQLQKKRIFDYALAVDGMRQILWGAFKKIVVANNCAGVVNQIFATDSDYSGGTLAIGAIFFTFQMYADFSGYTDMATGVAKLLGFRVTKNFNYPLFAQNIADFWRRWHISLTSWLTDYVFIPLNVKWRNWGKWGMILAIIIDFAICGLWHGANWTFVLWGLYNGLLFMPLILSGAMFKKTKIAVNKYGFPTLKTLSNMLLTFLLVTLGLIIFRAENIHQVVDYIAKICSPSILSISHQIITKTQQILAHVITIFSVMLLLVCEWYAMEKGDEYFKCKRIVTIMMVLLILLLGAFKDQFSFIYFQF